MRREEVERKIDDILYTLTGSATSVEQLKTKKKAKEAIMAVVGRVVIEGLEE